MILFRDEFLEQDIEIDINSNKFREIWNEYDLCGFNTEEQPPEVYTKMLKAAYTEIKKVSEKFRHLFY